MTLDASQRASVFERNARRMYEPGSPGILASACEEPSSARPAPSKRRRRANEHRKGTAANNARPRADDLRASRMDVACRRIGLRMGSDQLTIDPLEAVRPGL